MQVRASRWCGKVASSNLAGPTNRTPNALPSAYARIGGSTMISHRGQNALITLAPAQARLHLRPGVYLRRNRPAAADAAARVAVLLVGIAFLHWPLALVGCGLLIWPIRRFLAVRRALFRGSPLAAKVISLDPPLVACVAEMSRALNATYPVLAVLKSDLRFELMTLESGDRVAVVGLPLGGVPARADRLPGVHCFVSFRRTRRPSA